MHARCPEELTDTSRVNPGKALNKLMVPTFMLSKLPGILEAMLFVQGQSEAPPLLHKAPWRSQGPLPKLLGSKPLTRNNPDNRGSGCRRRRRLGSRPSRMGLQLQYNTLPCE